MRWYGFFFFPPPEYLCFFFHPWLPQTIASPCLSLPSSACSLSLCASCSARQQSTNAPWHVLQLPVTMWPSFAQWPNGDLPSYHHAQALCCTGPRLGQGCRRWVGVRVEDEGGEEGRVLPLTGTITSTDSEINGLRAEEAPKHFNTTCEIRCVKSYYRCNLYPCSCNADNVMCWFSRVWWKSNICAPEQLDGFYWGCDRNNHWPVW